MSRARSAAALSVGRGCLFGCALLLAGCAPTSVVLPAAVPSPSTSAPAVADGVSARVVRVVDGDTVHVQVDGRDLDVRIVGVDTPETKKPGTPVQCHGPEATAAARRLLDGQTVTLTTDPTQASTDRYGRALRYVRLADGRDYSLVAVAAGDGRAYKLASGRARVAWPQLQTAEREAQQAGRGLWGPPCLGAR